MQPERNAPATGSRYSPSPLELLPAPSLPPITPTIQAASAAVVADPAIPARAAELPTAATCTALVSAEKVMATLDCPSLDTNTSEPADHNALHILHELIDLTKDAAPTACTPPSPQSSGSELAATQPLSRCVVVEPDDETQTRYTIPLRPADY